MVWITEPASPKSTDTKVVSGGQCQVLISLWLIKKPAKGPLKRTIGRVSANPSIQKRR